MTRSWAAYFTQCCALALIGLATTGQAAPSAAMAASPSADCLTWGSADTTLHASGDATANSAEELPAEVAAQIAAMRISQEPVAKIAMEEDAHRKTLRFITNPAEFDKARRAYQLSMNTLAKEARSRFILRSLYSRDQMRERMTWFWLNHFSVQAAKSDIRATVGDYEDKIRDRSLGQFRDLLEATLRHPAMLRYLDNTVNAAGKINENYAREILELHTMGVGSGYSQKDVQELARILTGVGINLNPESPQIKPALRPLYIRDGVFEFNPARHDFGDKKFLGHTINGEGFDEVEKALDLIASSPATAHHVSQRIATYFAGDAPSPAMVSSMARVFIKSGGNIKEVVDTMARSPQFAASRKQSFKDPAYYTLSAVRIMYGDKVIVNTQPIINWMNQMDEGLYNHQTPDGYDLTSAAWLGSGQMTTRFEVARQIGNGSASLFQTKGAPTKAFTVPRLQDAPHVQALLATFGKATQDALAQAKSPTEWNTLFLSSPEFMRK